MLTKDDQEQIDKRFWETVEYEKRVFEANKKLKDVDNEQIVAPVGRRSS